MDKLYTMMYSLDNLGRIATTSRLSILTNTETLRESLLLPLPTGKKITVGGGNSNSDLQDIVNKYIIADINDAPTLKNFRNTNPVEYLKMMHELLDFVNTHDINVDEDSWIVSLINRHNTTKITAEGLKNRVVNTLYTCSTDIKNLEASSQPMISKPINNLIDEVELERDERNSRHKKAPYNHINPYTKFAIQYENSVGKKNVGIAANGIKAAAALQQYFNEFFTEWDGKSTVPPQYLLTHRGQPGFAIHLAEDLKDDLGNIIGTRNIFDRNFVIIGDVVLDSDLDKAKEKFITLHQGIDVNEDSEIRALKAMLTNNREFPQVKNADGSFVYYRADGRLRSEYKELQSIYKLYADSTGNSLYGNELDFLFFRQLFNPNVADMISIMISLSTDNAKELALARINANPQLMSIPLAMFTLGIPPKVVIDTCINLLDPIARAMEGSKIQDPNLSSDVRSLIQAQDYNESTKLTLLDIYDFAQELRTVTSFFKINQGLSAQYVELLGFYKRLADSKRLIQKRKGLPQTDLINLELLLNPDMNESNTEWKTYKNSLIAELNDLKTGVNIIDVVMKNSNFLSMLQSMQNQLQTLQHVSAAAKFVNVRSVAYAEEMDTSNYRRLINLYLDFIIGKTLDKCTDLKFTPRVLLESLGVSELPLSWGLDSPFDLSTEVGINNFMQIMDNVVIPQLKDKYSENFFFRSLDEKYSRNLDKNTYQLLFDVFNDEDISEAENIQNAIISFNRIKDNNSGLTTVHNLQLTIGDALYLYNMIAHKGRMSGLTMVLDCTMDIDATIPKLLDDTYKEYDEKVQNGLDDELLQEWSSLDLTQQAVLSGDNTATRMEDGARLDLRSKYIQSKVLPIRSVSLNNFKEELEKSDVTLIETDMGNNKMLLTLNINPVGISLPYYITKTTSRSEIVLDGQVANLIRNVVSLYLKGFSKESEGRSYEILPKSEFIKRLDIGGAIEPSIIKSALNKSNIVFKIETITSPSILSSRSVYYTKLDGQLSVVVDSKALANEMVEFEEVMDSILSCQIEEVTSLNKLNKYKELLDSLDLDDRIKKDKLQAYYEYLNNSYPSKSIIKLVTDKISQHNIVLNDVLTYYQPINFDLNVEKFLKEGDLAEIIDSNGFASNELYMYCGIIEGLHTFATINGKIYRTENISNDNVQIKQRLRTSSSFVTRPKHLKYEKNWIPFKSLSLSIGDKIHTKDGLEGIICESVYDVTKNMNYSPIYIVQDNKGTTFTLNTSEIAEVLPTTLFKNANVQRYSDIQIHPNFDSSRAILNDLQSGDLVTVKGKEVTFKERITKTDFRDSSGQIHKYSDITRVQSYRNLNPDKKFEYDASPLKTRAEKGNITLSQGLIQVSRSCQGLLSGYSTYFMQGDRPVLNLGGYHTTLKETISIGDIFTVLKNDVLTVYKVTNSSTEVTNDTNKVTYELSVLGVQVLRGGQGGGEVVPTSTFARKYVDSNDPLFKTSYHYTTSPEILSSRSEVTYIDSPTEKGSKFIDWLKDKLQVTVKQTKLRDGLKAYFENGIIYIDSSITDEAELISLSIHELSHLALATLRLEHPDTYASLVSRFLSSQFPSELRVIFSEIDSNGNYTSAIDRLEEKIIRTFDYFRSGDDIYEADSIEQYVEDILNDAYSYLLEISPINHIISDPNQSISSVLSRNDFFKETVERYTLHHVKEADNLKRALKSIKEVC